MALEGWSAAGVGAGRIGSGEVAVSGDEAEVAGGGDTMATSHSNGSSCGASWMRCANIRAATARLPCTRPETSQPNAVYRVWVPGGMGESMVTTE